MGKLPHLRRLPVGRPEPGLLRRLDLWAARRPGLAGWLAALALAGSLLLTPGCYADAADYPVRRWLPALGLPATAARRPTALDTLLRLWRGLQ